MSTDYIDIVFDGPPAHESGRFVEVENSEGKSIKFGERVQRPDGYWVLRIPEVTALQLRVTSLETALMGFLRYFQSGNPIPVERATIMANSEAVRFAESILPPSGPQEA